MSDQLPLTRGGAPWVPEYLLSIDMATCLGCGRCFKVCGRDVMSLLALDEDGGIVDIETNEEDIERKVATVSNPDNCIGCGACKRVCAKNCQSHGQA
jgi:Nif-specific ferredoxin III